MSRVMMAGVGVDASSASATATAVVEFLERSPIKILKSARFAAAVSSADLSNDPEGVDLVNVRFSLMMAGGNLDSRLSGRMVFTDFRGKFADKNSAVFIGAEKFWEFPPITAISFCFCSGKFQRKSSFGAEVCFFQYSFELSMIKTPKLY